MKANDIWIRDTMESISNILRAEASTDMFAKISLRIEKQNLNIRFIQPKIIWRIAASVVLLAGINFLSCMHFDKTNTVTSNEHAYSFSADYFSYLNSLKF